MKYLIKTESFSSLGNATCDRVVYDSTNDKVYLQKWGGGN